MPGTVNPVIKVVGDVGETIAVIAGLFGSADHKPVPVAAIVAVENWHVV